MPLDFPASPNTNDEFTSGGTTWAFDGSKWQAVTTAFTDDLKANGGLVIEAAEVAVDLGATNITGTLGVGDGGTGQTTYTDGQLLIGNSTGNTLTPATLTAGSNINITNGNGSISIDSTAGGLTRAQATAITLILS